LLHFYSLDTGPYDSLVGLVSKNETISYLWW